MNATDVNIRKYEYLQAKLLNDMKRDMLRKLNIRVQCIDVGKEPRNSFSTRANGVFIGEYGKLELLAIFTTMLIMEMNHVIEPAKYPVDNY